MPRVKLPDNSAVTAEQIGEVLKGALGARYEIRPATGPDWRVVETGLKAATVKLYQRGGGERFIQVNGSPPSVITRLLLTIPFGIPAVYCSLVLCKPVAEDVVQALEGSPELDAGSAEPTTTSSHPSTPS